MAVSQPKLTVIEAGKATLRAKLEAIYLFRELFWMFVVKNIKVRYKQTILGFSWALIQPLTSVLIFSVVFGKLAKLDTNGMPYPLFNYAAVVPWTYFSSSLTAASNVLVGNNMISKVYFPRIILPASTILGNLLDLLVGLLMTAGFLVYYRVVPGYPLFFTPVLLLILLLFLSGLSFFLSAIAIQYRDIKFSLPFFIQLLLYVSPVVWSATKVPLQYQTLYSLNPLVGVIEGFRAAYSPGASMPWHFVWPGACLSLVLFLAGFVFFHKREKFFADVF